ncbi:hypothetical protein HDU67_000277 [Dinochytrium kinnereticum]|nr:hypothetical protein HDU67_000277 [Dinochytrium kinnereticum]
MTRVAPFDNSTMGQGVESVMMLEEKKEVEESWSVPDFGVEVICLKCFTDYKFCTKCGGGGLWRSGRWRPHQLFDQGRKTCRLPHYRPGPSTQFRYVVYRIPIFSQSSAYGAHPPSQSLQAYTDASMPSIPYVSTTASVRDSLARLSRDTVKFWKESSLNSIADAFTMQRAMFAETWEKIERTKGEFAEQLEIFIKGMIRPDAQLDPRKRIHRFLCLAFFPCTKRRRGAKKTGDDATRGYSIGGCCTAQFFVDDRHVSGRFVTSVGQFGFHPNSMVPPMILSLFQRVQSDIQTYSLPPPLYVWGFSTWGKGKERTRKSLLIDVMRYGGRSLEEYCEVSGCNILEMKALCKDFIANERILEERDIYIGEWGEASQLVRTIEGRRFFLSGFF